MSADEDVPVWLRELCERLQSDEKATLTVVNLNIRRVNHLMMAVLCEVLRESTALRSLNLTSCLIDRLDMTSSQVVQPLIQAVLPSTTCLLQILHLSYNRLTGPLNGIGKALSVNHALTELYLDHNRIDCDTAIELSKGLLTNRTLQILQLSSNLIGDKGASHLAQALIPNKSLRTLGLSRNFIGQDGGQAFVDAMWKHKNTTLTLLDLQNNPSAPAETVGWVTALCQANAVGRRILLFEADSKPGVMAPLLAKASRTPSALFLFLQEVHSIFPSSSAESTSCPPKKKARH